MIEQTFITEINKLISVYGSISYFDKKSLIEIVQIVSFNNPLRLSMVEDIVKNTLNFQLTKIDVTLQLLNNKKIHNFSFIKVGSKRKLKAMCESIETIIVREQQKFDVYDVLNLIKIPINDDRILNILKKHKNVYYKLTPIGILFPSSITNGRKQIVVTCRVLNDAKIALINGKIYNILGIINLNKINNWEYIKGKSLWVNVNFNGTDHINNSEHIYFLFERLSLNDLLDFSINLIDNNGKAI